MANLNGQQVCDEVAWRIANRLAASGTGAGSIINFTNDILGLIGSAASWEWDQQVSSATPTAAGFINGITSLDIGKKMSLFNTDGTPIEKIDQAAYLTGAQGYVGVNSTTSYNAFFVLWDQGGLVPFIQVVPPLAAVPTVSVYYHLTQPVLVYGANPTVRWTISAMDALLKDWVTAKVKMTIGMSGGEAEWGDCMGRIKEFRRMYTTERENTGPEDEAATEVQSKQTIGRA